MARTILVVDDEPTLRETIVEALEADGFRVVDDEDRACHSGRSIEAPC